MLRELLKLLVAVVSLASWWMIFKKMGREGWEGIVPVYNIFLLFQELYGDGWRCLLLLIPLYNIYVVIKMHIDLAGRFHQSAGFGVGMTFLGVIFNTLLGFGDYVYEDGSKANTTEDFVSRTGGQVADKVKNAVDKDGDGQIDFMQNNAAPKAEPKAEPKAGEDIAEKLRKLNELKEQGLITAEEFEAKKAELLAKM